MPVSVPFPWENWRAVAETVPGLLPVAEWILGEMTSMLSALCKLVSALILEKQNGGSGKKRNKVILEELKCWVEEEVCALVELVSQLPNRADDVRLADLWSVAMIPSLSAPPLLRKMLEQKVSDLCSSKKGRQVLKRLRK